MSHPDLTPQGLQADRSDVERIGAATLRFADHLRNEAETARASGVAGDRPSDDDPSQQPPPGAPSTEGEVRSSPPWDLIGLVPAEVMASSGVALRRMGDADLRSVAVTSTISSEGRTTVALGFAAATISQCRRTILIDLDVLHRDVQRLLPLQPGPGVMEFLAGQASIDECLQPAGQYLDVVTAGLADSGPETRLDRLADLVGGLIDRCDLLVADLPPLEAGVTAARIADMFDSVALVVRAGGVTVPAIERAVSFLRQRPHVVLNNGSKRRGFRRLSRRRS